jgi:hypothetical protein
MNIGSLWPQTVGTVGVAEGTAVAVAGIAVANSMAVSATGGFPGVVVGEAARGLHAWMSTAKSSVRRISTEYF